ncbi:hypothetical protein GGP41_000592 [Bipolaris sorokiniana]|uniref:Uncharacterized protein n=2 Tax=Cochliobolus sativus TaxID=45130 RepID=A0A8H6DXW7_COCSA|nr:uncharacterized protein COCSADRAFT_194323 [Bipolaris sorokiniana ND90Pr]EMD58894.1 hypothetical protein COCSADRAFT_194323 [Bipolaris sorokiniana ND90Pr]KAF5851808.1 hypothetical protein GGP41_000592 [Bipolaris sorokiniana]
MSTKEQNSTFRHSPSHPGEAVTTKSRKLTTSPGTKLDRARPRVMLLTACFVYLTTTLFAFQISVTSILNLISPEYERFNDQLLAYSSALRKEQIVYSRLDNVLSSELNRGFMETHEDCLVRGLERANHELIGLGFRYPDVREKIMEWTMENCGRLQHAPQVVNEEPTPQEAVLTYWASLSYHARRIAKETLELVKQKLGWVLGRLLDSDQHEDASPRIDHAADDEDMHTDDSVTSERVLPKIPFGFALQCQPDLPCRLYYPTDSTADSQELHVSPETINKFEQRTAELFTFNNTLDQMGSIISQALRVVVYFEIFFLSLSVIMFIYSLIIKSDSSYSHLGTEATYLIKSMMIEHLSAAAAFTLDKYPGIFPNIRSALVFAFIITTLGLNMVLKLLLSGSQLETIYNIRQSLHDLYLILRNRKIPGEEYTPQVDDEGNEGTKDDNPKTESSSRENDSRENKAIAASPIPSSPLKPHHRFADPTTTVQEDIRRSRESLRQERTEQQIANERTEGDGGFDTDTESKNDAFVHIAIDATNQVSISDEPAW